jgi:penicillin-binding protein 2
MLILDELKKNDPQLRFVAVMMAAGFCILLVGLWWVQIVSAREYQGHLETQSYRTVRLPAMRGRILDREGRVLAENRPRYNLCLYLDDLRSQFQAEYARLRPVRITTNPPPFWTFGLGSGRVVTNRVRLNRRQIDALTWQARYDVASSVVSQVSRKLGQPLTLDPAKFQRDYEIRLAMPYPIVPDASPEQVARFEEQDFNVPGADVELQSVRDYPLGTMAGHVLGYLSRDNNSVEGEDAYYSYRLPDYRGVVGIEGGFDEQLRGRAGVESVLVNNLGYRQSETILEAPEPGENVVLTIDLDLQRAAAESLAAHQGADARGAVVVMDVRSGDVLAMVSSPEIDPNYWVGGMSADEFQKETVFLNDLKLRPQINRATQENYAPGSIFKTIVALAALENGLDPKATIYNPENPADPGHGYVQVGNRPWKDLAQPGDYNFRRAFERSCNTYFITVGLRAGIENIIAMGEQFHLGEHTDLPTMQDGKGSFPSLNRVRSDWRDGDTANLCIGQGEIAVTPMQMAVEISAIANGGYVLWPRLIERIEPQDPASGEVATNFPSSLVRDKLKVRPRSLQILRDAMLGETEDAEGTGHAAAVPGLHICGKTGTAQVMNARNQEIGRTTWFASFAPYEHPRYAVVVMVEGGTYGGTTCAPIAHDIYEEILKKENSSAQANVAQK